MPRPLTAAGGQGPLDNTLTTLRPYAPATSIHHPSRAEGHGNRPWQLAMISPSEVSTQLKAGFCGQPLPESSTLKAGLCGQHPPGEPESSTLEASFCGQPSLGAGVIHAGGRYLWTALTW